MTATVWQHLLKQWVILFSSPDLLGRFFFLPWHLLHEVASQVVRGWSLSVRNLLNTVSNHHHWSELLFSWPPVSISQI
jgi:hypothetical protein